MHSFTVANLANRTTITRDLPRVPPLESAHFSLQLASSRIDQRLPKDLHEQGVECISTFDCLPSTRWDVVHH